jgi:hypothetical protein
MIMMDYDHLKVAHRGFSGVCLSFLLEMTKLSSHGSTSGLLFWNRIAVSLHAVVPLSYDSYVCWVMDGYGFPHEKTYFMYVSYLPQTQQLLVIIAIGSGLAILAWSRTEAPSSSFDTYLAYLYLPTVIADVCWPHLIQLFAVHQRVCYLWKITPAVA